MGNAGRDGQWEVGSENLGLRKEVCAGQFVNDEQSRSAGHPLSV